MHSTNGVWFYNTRDVMRASNCSHCLHLAIARTLDLPGVVDLVKQYEPDPNQIVFKHGNKFEAKLVEELNQELADSEFVDLTPLTAEQRYAQTLHHLKIGTAVIYQCSLRQKIGETEFRGSPDFLVREDYLPQFSAGKFSVKRQIGEPEFGLGQNQHRYVAWDAKVASHPKPENLIQLGLYADCLIELGFASDLSQLGLILGSHELAVYDAAALLPAARRARKVLVDACQNANQRFANLTLEQLELACPRRNHCRICEYPDLCEKQRLDRDDLSLVAGIRERQILLLQQRRVSDLSGLASLTDSDFVTGIAKTTLEKLRTQAKLQLAAREDLTKAIKILPDPEFEILPPPSEGDMFFDMEGFPYHSDGGLEYLFGITLRTQDFSSENFVPFWAHNRDQEKLAFENFIDFVLDRITNYPDAHIYHYANYELVALRNLATRHGTREAAVGKLIDDRRLVDLYKIVKGSMLIGAPSYSIKKLEPFYGFIREAEVSNALGSIEEYDQYLALASTDPDAAATTLERILSYNREDCESTLALYDWLASTPGAHSRYEEHERQLAERIANYASKKSEGEFGPASLDELELERLERQTEWMAAKLDNWPWGESEQLDYQAKIWQALTHSMLFYRREKVIASRDRKLATDAELEDLERDRKALVIHQVSKVQETGTRSDVFPIMITYRAVLQPEQTCLIKPGQDIFVRFAVGPHENETEYGSLIEVSESEVVFSRRCRTETAHLTPDAIFENNYRPPQEKEPRVRQWAEGIAKVWKSPDENAPTHDATLNLLLRRPPVLTDGRKLPTVIGEDGFLPAVTEATELLVNSTLAIQGPPGSGKTFLASRVIKHLLTKKKSIGVVANSHAAIENLLQACLDAGVPKTQIAKRRANGDTAEREWVTPKTNRDLATWRAEMTGVGYVIGGTSWNFSAVDLQVAKFDYLFIDEAAQFSLVDAIAAGSNAKNLILLGDPQQLTQVVQAIHPGGVANSALGHYMGGAEILADETGYFVDLTYRMHPNLAKPVSWLSYRGLLHSHESTRLRCIENVTPGLIAVAVDHIGNSNHSIEEVNCVVELVRDLLSRTVSAESGTANLKPSDILVVAPYNAQVRAIDSALAAAGLSGIRVGTVDKFQGQEASAVIVSLAASSNQDAPRGLEFVLNRNRLNVAVSRAQVACYLVHSPGLLEADFDSVEQLLAISRFIGLLEHATGDSAAIEAKP